MSDQTPLYVIEDPEEDNPQEPESGGMNPWMLLLKIMFSPVDGWAELKESGLSQERYASFVYYPLLGLMAASNFIPMIYEHDATLTVQFIGAVVAFVSFFFSNLITVPLGSILVGKQGSEELKKPFGVVAVMVLYSSMAIFQTLYQLLPPLEPIIVFLPLWTAYLVSRLVPELNVPVEKRVSSMLLLGAFVIGMPILWDWLLNLLLSR